MNCVGIQSEYLWALFARQSLRYDGHLAHLLSWLPPERYPRILELGCGSGHFLRKLRERGYSPAGVDINVVRIELARLLQQSESDPCEFHACSAGAFHSEEPFDAALWMNVPLETAVLIEEFLGCITRNVRLGGRVLFDYLTLRQEDARADGKQWVDGLCHSGDQLLPEGQYRRRVWIDYRESPWTIHWIAERVDKGIVQPMFHYQIPLPSVDKSEVRDAYARQGWRLLGELGSGALRIDSDPTGLGFVLDIYERDV